MIERAFKEARLHRENKNPVRKFAIERAMDILRAAGVIDPAIKKDQAVVTRPQEVVEQPFYIIPEGTGVIFTRDIGGKPVEQLEAAAKSVRTLSGYAVDMMHNPKFTTLEEVTPQELIKLRVQDLGLTLEFINEMHHFR